ncbi:MAG TPA: thioredoxin domain-containing protein [Bryobacteraceae bacterium]|nr:thioredoxin domain-containing protein [Bryobacteraceae bacterium]
MRLLLKLCVLSVFASGLFGQSVMDWLTASDLPDIDLGGLTAPQKAQVLKILRETGCTCGCDMKLAECRIKDPACGFSRGLGAVIVKDVKAGKTHDQIMADFKASPLAKGPTQRPLLEDPIKIPIEGAPSKGPENAKVTLIEFSDFECPYCHLAVAEADALLRAFPNDIRLVYKQFPLPMHPHARLASAASLAANAQSKFWPMHDKLFANSRQLTRENILAWAKEIGLDMSRFTTDLDSGKYDATINKDVKDGDQSGVEGTPAFFINGKHYNGAFQVQSVKPLIEAELHSAASNRSRAAIR